MFFSSIYSHFRFKVVYAKAVLYKAELLTSRNNKIWVSHQNNVNLRFMKIGYHVLTWKLCKHFHWKHILVQSIMQMVSRFLFDNKLFQRLACRRKTLLLIPFLHFIAWYFSIDLFRSVKVDIGINSTNHLLLKEVVDFFQCDFLP